MKTRNHRKSRRNCISKTKKAGKLTQNAKSTSAPHAKQGRGRWRRKAVGNTKESTTESCIDSPSESCGEQSDYAGPLLGFRFVLGEQSCARLSSRVVEPLLRWRRVFVSRRGGQIIPLGTDFEPIDGHVINSQPQPTGPSLDSVSESQEDSGSSTLGTVKRRLKADPEVAGAVADKSGQKSATKRPGSIMSSNDEDTMTVVKKRARKSLNQPRDVVHYEANSKVYAVCMGEYVSATMLREQGCFGYEVEFSTDGSVKNVPHEAVAPLSWVAAGQKCFVGDDEGIISATPADLTKGLFTVSVLDQEGDAVDQNGNRSKTKYVRWTALTFPLSTWRKERAVLLREKQGIAKNTCSTVKSEFDRITERESRNKSVLTPSSEAKVGSCSTTGDTTLRRSRSLPHRQLRIQPTSALKHEDVQKNDC